MNPTKLHATAAFLVLLLVFNQDVSCHRLPLFSLHKRQSMTSARSRLHNTHHLPLLAALTDSPSSSRHAPQSSDMDDLDLEPPCDNSESDANCDERSNLDRTLMDLLLRVKSKNLRERLDQEGLTSDKPSAQKRRGHGRSNFYSNW